MANWTEKFLGLADHVSSWSKDPSTKVGCVITNPRNKILSIGYNGLPIGVEDTEERLERPLKYSYIVHAEANAIASAAEMGLSVRGGTLYCNYLSCNECAKLIIQSGIERVVYRNDELNSGTKMSQVTKEMFKEADIECIRA